MHDDAPIQNLERTEQILKDGDRLLLGNDTFPFNAIHQCPPIAKLIDEVHVVPGLYHLVVLDDVLALLQARQHLNLVHYEFVESLVLVQLLDGNRLHCEVLVLGEVRRPVDLAEAALADHLG